MRRGCRGLDVGVVRRAGDAGAPRAQPRGHVLLHGGRPGIVILAVEHECRDAARGELFGPVRGTQQVPGHGGEPGRIAGEHPLPQERDDRRGHPARERPRFQDAVPDLGDLPRAVVRGGGREELQHQAEFPGARSGQRRRAGTHQRERAGPVPADDGLAGHQAAEGVPEQVRGPGDLGQRGDVGPELPWMVGIRVVRARRLVLAAHVDREYLASGGGELAEHRDEVLLAARVAGHQQGGAQLSHAGRWQRHERGERAAGGFHGGPPRSFRQLQRGRRGHGQDACWLPSALTSTITSRPPRVRRLRRRARGAMASSCPASGASRAGTPSRGPLPRILARDRPRRAPLPRVSPRSSSASAASPARARIARGSVPAAPAPVSVKAQ
jgi:hypothetical protein